MISRHTGTLQSTFEALEGAVKDTRAFLEIQGIDGDLVFNVLLLVSEAVTNAMKHGNKWEESRSVTYEITVKETQIELWVEDEGGGFEAKMSEDFAEPEGEIKTGGRGLTLMSALTDEVTYENGGRRVRMIFLRAK